MYGFVFKLVKDDKEMEELKLTGLEGVSNSENEKESLTLKTRNQSIYCSWMMAIFHWLILDIYELFEE